MDHEDKRYVWMTAVIVGGVLTAMVTFSVLDGYLTKKFVEGGYSEVTLPGRDATSWQKTCQ